MTGNNATSLDCGEEKGWRLIALPFTKVVYSNGIIPADEMKYGELEIEIQKTPSSKDTSSCSVNPL